MALFFTTQRGGGANVFGQQSGGSAGTAPAFTTQPSPATITAGNTATFGPVAASGSPAPTYQWQRAPSGSSTFVDIGGATSASYTTAAATVTGGSANNGDQYRCVAANTTGSATSTAAALTVNAAADTTPPVLSAPITVSAITQTSYTLTFPTATDNVAVTGIDYSLDGGTSYTTLGVVTTINVTGRSAGTTDQVRVRARDAAGNLSSVLSAVVTLLAAADITPPTFTGFITATAVTQTTYTLSWPAATDAGGLAGYDLSLNGGGFTSLGSVLTTPVTGRTAGTTDTVQVRARDAAGNVTTLSLTVPLLAAQVAGTSGPAVGAGGQCSILLPGGLVLTSTGQITVRLPGRLVLSAAGVVSFKP